MKYLSIVAFLAMVVFFTLWSMYEDRKKQVIEEDFSTGMLQWIVEEEKDSVRIIFHEDTLEIDSPGKFIAWFDHSLTVPYRITFYFSLQTLGPDDDFQELNFYWGADGPSQTGILDYYEMSCTSENTGVCVPADRIDTNSVCDYFDEPVSVGAGIWNQVTVFADNKNVYVEWNGKKRMLSSLSNPEGYFGFSIAGGRLFLTGLEIRTYPKK